MKRLNVVVAVVLGLAMACSLNARASDKEETKMGDTGFTAYSGPQDWPTGKGAEINKDHSIPIYIGLPDKSYKVLGRISDTRQSGVDVVGKGLDEAFGKEKNRMRDCANRAKMNGADAVIVTNDPKVLKALNLTDKDVHESAPLVDHDHSVVLAVKF